MRKDMLNIPYEENIANIISTGSGVHGDEYKDLMEEDGTYSPSGVLFNGGKWYLPCVGCVMGLFLKGCGGCFLMEVV